MSDKQVAIVERKIIPLVEEAKSLQIKTPKDLERSVILLSQMNKIADGIKAEKKTIIDPAKAIIERETSRWKAAEDQYKEGIAIIRESQSVYQTEQVKIAHAAEEKIAARVGPGRGKLSTETAVAKIDEIKKPAKTIATSEGLVKFRTDKIVVIDDETKIPRIYIREFDIAMIKSDLLAGKAVAGCHIDEKQVPMNSR